VVDGAGDRTAVVIGVIVGAFVAGMVLTIVGLLLSDIFGF
jgi:hypothetical protein